MAAFILDGILLRIVGVFLGGLVTSLPLQEIPVIDVLYSVGFIAFGATPAMRAVKVRVVDGNGNPHGIKRSIVRYLIPATSWIPAVFVLGTGGSESDFGLPILIVAGIAFTILGILDALWMIWDANKQTLHDKLASTYVVSLRAD